MVTMWNVRGDHRPLWATVATIVGSYWLGLRLAQWGVFWQWVLVAAPVTVGLLWFLMAGRGVRDLGFPAAGRRTQAGQGPAAGAVAAVVAAVTAGALGVAVLAAAGTPDPAEPPGHGLVGLEVAAPALGVLAALSDELVYRGALLRLALSRFAPAAAIGLAGLLSVVGRLSLLLTDEISWGWLGARVLELAVLGLVLAWAAVRTGALWIPLGWHLGWSALGAALAHLERTPGTPAAAVALAAGHLVVIPLVLLLTRRPRAAR